MKAKNSVKLNRYIAPDSFGDSAVWTEVTVEADHYRARSVLARKGYDLQGFTIGAAPLVGRPKKYATYARGVRVDD